MLFWFRMKRRATLADILRSGERWVWEFRARKSELNAAGGPQIVLVEEHPKNANMNVYEVREPSRDGQFEMVL